MRSNLAANSLEIMNRETNKIKFSISEESILYIDCFPNTVMTITEGKESTSIGLDMVKGQPLPLLCDLTNVVKMTQECRQHFAGVEHSKLFTNCALIVTSPISRIIGNFFLGANRPIKPTRLFTSKEVGVKWLKEKMK